MITPFIAEKLYKKIGLTESVFSENSFIKKPIMIEKPSIVDEEEFIDEMIADIIKIKKVVKHVNTEKVYIFSNSRFFKSNKSESVVLKSSSEYNAIKTGSIPIINSENFSVQKEIFYNSNRPKLFFNRLQK